MKSVVVFVWLFSLAVSLDAEVISFSNDFNTVIPPEIDPGAATLTGVQGFAGLGPSGNQFEDNFLRSPTGSTVTLTLEDLPGHTAINLEFLFAAIDSLDGTGNFPSGDFFKLGFPIWISLKTLQAWIALNCNRCVPPSVSSAW